MKRIAIVGAAGYVGLELARQLRDFDFEVNAVARENGVFLLRDAEVRLVAPNDLASLGTVDVVVNLAYPTGQPQQFPAKNREILGQIDALMGSGSRLIHVSTQAVFGLALDRPITVGPVDQVRDYPYVEAKVELENLITSRFSGHSVQIVRLGNVWGPGSASWTVPLVNKVLFGEPVGVEGIDGFCNATDVANTASYLVHLIGREDIRGIRFHHLAEMSGHRWSEWIERIEGALGQRAVREPAMSLASHSLTDEVRQALSPVMPRALYRNLLGGRSSGSLLRSLARATGEDRFDRMKSGLKRSPTVLPAGHSLGAADKMFLSILCSETQFTTCVVKEWQPPLDFEGSWSRVEQWMRTAGYRLRQT